MTDRDSRYYKAYMEQNTVSRRGLFRALTGGARRSLKESEKSTYVLGVGELERVERVVARPPKALDETLFLQICDGCGTCATSCPEQVIEVVEGKAQLNLDYGYCSQCGGCNQVCPTGALHGSISDLAMRPVFSMSCQNAIFGDCYLCKEPCQTNAITITDYELPRVDNSKCDGCGRCKQSCPFSAIQIDYVGTKFVD
ncbi:ferredoxin-type protein NapF [Vibrio astriarenae]|nr:ferredoxin-type protein NapF [Vibrio sp. C7]